MDSHLGLLLVSYGEDIGVCVYLPSESSHNGTDQEGLGHFGQFKGQRSWR